MYRIAPRVIKFCTWFHRNLPWMMKRRGRSHRYVGTQTRSQFSHHYGTDHCFQKHHPMYWESRARHCRHNAGAHRIGMCRVERPGERSRCGIGWHWWRHYRHHHLQRQHHPTYSRGLLVWWQHHNRGYQRRMHRVGRSGWKAEGQIWCGPGRYDQRQ